MPRRIDKFLKDCTPLTIVALRQALADGRVTVWVTGTESKVVAADTLIFEADVVCFDGQPVRLGKDQACAVLNKPRSVTATARDPDGKRDLRAWLAQMPEGMFPVGRLDRDTTGLLLFTNDGDLSNAILQPDHRTAKRYWLWLDNQVEPGDPRLSQFTSGVQVGAHLLRAQGVEVQHVTADCTQLLVTMHEGKKRQIRRMCCALKLRLLHLHRLQVGPVSLGNLALGDWRLLLPLEVEQLWSATGGRTEVVRRKVEALTQLARQLRARGEPNERLDHWISARTPAVPATSRSASRSSDAADPDPATGYPHSAQISGQ